MMREEFEKMTGFYPTLDLYRNIEEAYTSFNGDKVAFCKAYAKNTDGMAEAIQRKTDIQSITTSSSAAKESAERIETLEREIKRLAAALEREQEWKPYEDEHNVRQADYERLASDSTTRELSIGEAKELIASEFGFDITKISIITETKTLEINRHRQTRATGTFERKPQYNATDWNYIRFNVRGNVTMAYEMHNGDLRMFWC